MPFLNQSTTPTFINNKFHFYKNELTNSSSCGFHCSFDEGIKSLSDEIGLTLPKGTSPQAPYNEFKLDLISSLSTHWKATFTFQHQQGGNQWDMSLKLVK